jgi:hypothetical protein
MTNVNQFKNVLGIYPRGWRLPITYRLEVEKDNGKREEVKRDTLVRLMGVVKQEIKNPDDKPMPEPGGAREVPGTGPAAKFYEKKTGFANWYFNKLERDRVLAGLKKQADLTGTQKEWVIEADGDVKNRQAAVTVKIKDEGTDKKVVEASVGGVEYKLEPLKKGLSRDDLREPRGSGGILLALYHYQELLAVGEKAFTGGFSYGGYEPCYPPPAEDVAKVEWAKQRVDCDVLRTEEVGVKMKWYFSRKDGNLIHLEMFAPPSESTAAEGDDPCEVYFSDYKAVGGVSMPHRIQVWFPNERGQDQRYCNLAVKSYKFAGK